MRDEIFACTDLNATAEEIISWFVMRWSLEVTLEEAREHLGMELRWWSEKAHEAGARRSLLPPP